MEDEFTFFVEEDTVPVYNIKHRAFNLSKDVIAMIEQVRFEKIYFSLFDQLLRSATSNGANLVEGIAGVSKKDFINYNAIALKSANETKYWFCLIKEIDIVNKNKIDQLIKETDQISKIIGKIIVNTKRNQQD
jgi:four helix bundle protein